MKRTFVHGLCYSAALSLLAASVAMADSTAQTLPYTQDWSVDNISSNDDWSGVSGIIGYIGITGATDDDNPNDTGDSNTVDVSNDSTTTSTGGGVHDISGSTIGLQGSGSAANPHIVIHLDTTGFETITVAYDLIDLDAQDAIQPIGLQYRVGGAGAWTHVATVADASDGAGLITPVSEVLPGAADNAALVEVRILTEDAAGSDSMTGIDNISITGSAIAPSPTNTVTVDSGASADGVTVFNTIQAAIASFASGGVNAGETPPFTVNVEPSGNPYVETLSLNDADTGNGDIQGDIVIQSATPGTLIDCRLNATNGDDGVLIYQSTLDVTITDFIFSPEQGAGVADDLVKLDENADSAPNTITFNSCIFTDVADAGGPLISAFAGSYSAPAAFTGQLAGTDCLVKHWGDNAEQFDSVFNDCLFYGANCRGIQYGTIATGGGQYDVNVNGTTFAFMGEAGTRAPIDLQGNGAQAKILTINDSTFTGSRHHAILVGFQDTNAHTVNINNTVFDSTNASRAYSGDDNTSLNLDNVTIHQGTSNPAIVYGGWDDTDWTNVTIQSAGSNAVLTVEAGAANTITVRDSIISGAGTAFGTLATVTEPAIDIDDSAIVQAGPDAVTAVGTPGGLSVGGNVTTTDPAYVDAANGDFTVQSWDYAAAGSNNFSLGGAAGFDSGASERAATFAGLTEIGGLVTDDLEGVVIADISGGFHGAASGTQASLTDNTVNEGINDLNGLMADFPGDGVPSYSGFYTLASGGNVANVSEIRIVSGNNGGTGGNGRSFHNVNLYTTTEDPPAAGSVWTPLIFEVIPAPFGSAGGAATDTISLSVLRDEAAAGDIASGITGLRVDFFATGNTADRFDDPYDAVNPLDRDGFGAAVEGAIMKEIEADFSVVTNVNEWMILDEQ